MRTYLFCVAFVVSGSVAGLGIIQSPASANEPATKTVAAATPAPATVSPEELAALRAGMAAMKARLDLLESQQSQQATMALDERQKRAEAAELAKSKPAPGLGVHIIETAGTDVRLYGLLEATFAGYNHANAAGAPKIGMPVSWFSGNRWGFDINQKLSSGDKPAGSNTLSLIAKLESEFELPSGNQDTPGTLFNRDAWVGIQSKAFGKLTVGRQNALPRDVAAIWGDPYGSAANSTAEGGFSNTNNFKQFIYYASGGNGAGGQGDTRYDAAVVYKKQFDNGFFMSAAYDFGDANGPGGPNGSGPIAGAEFNKGSSVATGIGFNAGRFHTSAFYTSSNVLETGTIGGMNLGHQAQSLGLGGNYDAGKFRVNAGAITYTSDQAGLGRRRDIAWTTSAKLVPTKFVDYELGVQEFYAHNAAVNAKGFVLRPFQDAVTNGKRTIDGSRFTVYGSIITHPITNVDVYLAADDLLTGGGYLDSRANGFKHVIETATGVRYRF